MNVQLFLFIAAYFSLHQNWSYTLPWWKQHRKELFFNAEEATQGVLLADPWWLLGNQMWEHVVRLWGPCFISQSLRHLLLLPLVCFQLKEALPFQLNHLPWSRHAFSLLSLNGVCTIWTFPLLVDRICKYRDGFSGWFPHDFLLLGRAWNRQNTHLLDVNWVALLSTSPAPSFPPRFVCLSWDGFLGVCANITTFYKNSSE